MTASGFAFGVLRFITNFLSIALSVAVRLRFGEACLKVILDWHRLSAGGLFERRQWRFGCDCFVSPFAFFTACIGTDRGHRCSSRLEGECVPGFWRSLSEVLQAFQVKVERFTRVGERFWQRRTARDYLGEIWKVHGVRGFGGLGLDRENVTTIFVTAEVPNSSSRNRVLCPRPGTTGRRHHWLEGDLDFRAKCTGDAPEHAQGMAFIAG